MNIELEKLELIKMLLETNDKSVIASIKNIFTSKKKDFWNELTPEQKDEIQKGIDEIERGEFVSYESIVSKYRY